MLKEYRKTTTINAEKFGTTLKQIEKYSLIYVSSKNFYWIETKTGIAKLKAGDWIATGVDGEHWPISNEVFQQTYMEVYGGIKMKPTEQVIQELRQEVEELDSKEMKIDRFLNEHIQDIDYSQATGFDVQLDGIKLERIGLKLRIKNLQSKLEDI